MNEHPISNGHRILTLLVALALSASALAEPSGGEERFTVTLQPAAALDAASAAERLASAYGGTLEDGESGGESFIVQISPSRARLMAADPHVAAVEPTAQAAVPPEIVTWSSGVTFSYDGSGNIRQIGQDKFGYDAVGRLVHAKVNEVVRDYQYDAFGNRESCSQAAGTEDCQAGYTVDPATNRIAEIQYDPAGSGNVIGFRGHTYAYDALNMMTSDTFVGTREFIYTPDDGRIGTYSSVSRSWQWTIRDTSGKILREFVSDGGPIGTGTWTWSKDYVWRDGVLLASRQTNGTTTNTFHYHLDHLGSPRRITDGNDRIVGFHDYFAFGVEAGGHDEQPQSRLQYTGHERDAQGDDFASLDYMLARYYSPMLGRFLSVDPARDSVIPVEPQTWNRYTYAWNNPLKFIDPTGKNATVICEQDGRCTASVRVQVVADPNSAAQMATANTYKQASESYWNGRIETGQNNEIITFNLAVTIVAPGQQQAGMDTVTVVNGTGRSNIQMTLGPTSIPDTGTLYTNDNTGNQSGMAGIGPHESGHLFGLRDMYYQGEVVGYNPAPTVDIMRYAQPTNGAQTAFMVLSPANLNKTIHYRPPTCRHQPCQ